MLQQELKYIDSYSPNMLLNQLTNIRYTLLKNNTNLKYYLIHFNINGKQLKNGNIQFKIGNKWNKQYRVMFKHGPGSDIL